MGPFQTAGGRGYKPAAADLRKFYLPNTSNTYAFTSPSSLILSAFDRKASAY